MAIETQAAQGSLTAVGSAMKAFAVMHPVGLSFSAGLLVGLTICYRIKRRSKNKQKTLKTATG